MAAFPEATTSTFDELALQAEGLVIVDFFTPDCMPCRKLEPILEAVVGTVGDSLRVVRVNAAEARDLAERYAVHGVPTLVLLANGAELDRRVGFYTAHQLREWVRPHLA